MDMVGTREEFRHTGIRGDIRWRRAEGRKVMEAIKRKNSRKNSNFRRIKRRGDEDGKIWNIRNSKEG